MQMHGDASHTRAHTHTHPYTHTHGCRVCYKNSYKDTPRTHARTHTRTHMGAGSLQQRCAVVEPRLLLEVHEAERRRRGHVATAEQPIVTPMRPQNTSSRKVSVSPIRSLKVETEKPKTSAEISETELTASAQFVLILRTAAFAAGMVYIDTQLD